MRHLSSKLGIREQGVQKRLHTAKLRIWRWQALRPLNFVFCTLSRRIVDSANKYSYLYTHVRNVISKI